MTTNATKAVSNRRSSRRCVATYRAQQYINDYNNNRPIFPSVSDEICVKWFVNGKFTWWPATVLSVQSSGPHARKCEGQVLYQKFEQYEPVVYSVVFSGSTAENRLVTSIDSVSEESDEPASWVYSDEIIDVDEGSDIEYKQQDRSNNVTKENVKKSVTSQQKFNAHSSGNSIAIPRQKVNRLPLKVSKPIHKKLSESNALNPISDQAGPSSALPGRSSSQKTHIDVQAGTSSVIRSEEDRKDDVNPTSSILVPVSSSPSDTKKLGKNHADLDVRLELIERQLQSVNPKSSVSSVNSSTQSVLSALRWAFLRTLEKPLKHSQEPALSQHGLARQEISVCTHCDYYTFRDISSMLAAEHKFASDEPQRSRLAFSPAYQTIQSGSGAANDLNILFSCLSDLTSFLRIRDDNDFEAILTKEVVSNTLCLLRILGTFVINKTDESTATGNGKSVSDVSTDSKSMTSVSLSSESH